MCLSPVIFRSGGCVAKTLFPHSWSILNGYYHNSTLKEPIGCVGVFSGINKRKMLTDIERMNARSLLFVNNDDDVSVGHFFGFNLISFKLLELFTNVISAQELS